MWNIFSLGIWYFIFDTINFLHVFAKSKASIKAITIKQLPIVKSIDNRKNQKSPFTTKEIGPKLLYSKFKLLLSYFSTSAIKDWHNLLRIMINIPKLIPIKIENSTQYVQNTSFQSHVINESNFKLAVESWIVRKSLNPIVIFQKKKKK